MKLFISSILLLSTLAVSAQNIIVKKTDKHVTVDGTSLKMIPPANFEKGQNFYGFQEVKTQSSIVVFQVNMDFTKQTAGFKKEVLVKSGLPVNNYRRFKINDDSAVYISTKQEWDGDVFLKEILAIGNKDRTVVINAACLNNHPEMVKVLKDALFSSFIQDEELPKSAIDLVDFTLDATGTDLEYYDKASRGLNALVYTNKNIAGKPMMIATKSLTTAPEDHKTYAKESIKELSFIIPEKTTFFKEITLEGLSGYESITEAKDKEGNKKTLYKVIVFTSTNHYYSFVGTIDGAPVEENLARFRKLIKTFKRR